MKKRIGIAFRGILSLSWVVVMLLGMTAASFATSHTAPLSQNVMLAVSPSPMKLIKDETVFASLNFNGTINSLSVVNRIHTPNEGSYTDYGRYTEIKNLSGIDQPQTDGNQLIWQLPASDKGFYYEGVLEQGELPFTFSLGYFLDGRGVNAEDLIGASGEIKIQLKITSNKKANPYFVDNYLAQVQLSLSLDKCSNIEAKHAQSVIVGSTNTLAFMVMPGKSMEYAVTFDARNFEMGGITASVTPMDVQSLIGLDTKDIAFEQADMEEGVSKLVSGTEQLKEGVSKLADGIKKSASGLMKLVEGSLAYEQGLKSYTAGVSAISENANQLSQGMNQLDQNGSVLTSGYAQMSEGTIQLLEGLLSGLPAAQQAMFAPQVEKAKQGLKAYGENLDGYTQGVSKASQGMSALSGGLSDIVKNNPAILLGAAELNEGMVQFGHGLDALYEGARLIPGEIQKLVDGQKQMKEGIDEALSLLDGFNFETGTTSKPVSFAESSQTVNSVQFVIRTPELKPEPVTATLTVVREPKSFWEKLVALFRK